MKKTLQYLFLLSLVALLGTSCANRKKMIYFQEDEFDSIVRSAEQYTPRFRIGDFLQITISGASEEAVAIYNPLRLENRENFTGVYSSDNPQSSGYIINEEGNINFPVLGKIPAGGKTKLELEQYLAEALAEHIDLPVINIRLRNFRVTVLGDVLRPGTFIISSENITLPQALGISGDLSITAKRKNILVIRENDGVKEFFRVDLTKNEVFSSPAYYLQQNDVIYVEQNRAKLASAQFSPVYSVLISVTSLIIGIAVLLTN